MILLIPSAKTLDFETPPTTAVATLPARLPEAETLAKALARLDPRGLQELLGISDTLAAGTAARYAAWEVPFPPGSARQALLAYAGDLYEGLGARTLTQAGLAFAQERLRILSGLYGLLRPMDLILPYRLEMGAKLSVAGAQDLYAYWGSKPTDDLNALLDGEAASGREPVLVALASQEFMRAVKVRRLRGRVITPVFQDGRDGAFKVVSFFAKRARGLMARFALQKRLADPERLKGFSSEGYAFAPEASTEDAWVFRREA